MHQRWKSVLREAIAYVNEANIHCGGIDDEDGCPYDLNNPKDEWYEIEDVNWDLLQGICERNDYRFTTGRAVVYEGLRILEVA